MIPPKDRNYEIMATPDESGDWFIIKEVEKPWVDGEPACWIRNVANGTQEGCKALIGLIKSGKVILHGQWDEP